MKRPHIGITTSYDDGRQTLDHAYVLAIEKAGGLPMIVPMHQTTDAMEAFASLLDGLVITGGPGIVRRLIGELPDDLPVVDPVRDKADTLVYQAMHDRPVLGICYGMQFINAQAGGSIYADVTRQRVGSLVHSHERGGREHLVQFCDDSRLRAIFGARRLETNTYHIQAVAEVGAGLRAVGHSADGVIEAIESHDGRLTGVQFHPERMLGQTKPLFEDFVARCRR